jgi:hypothetical protein
VTETGGDALSGSRTAGDSSLVPLKFHFVFRKI